MTSNVFFMKTNIWNNAFTQTLAYENDRYVHKMYRIFQKYFELFNSLYQL